MADGREIIYYDLPPAPPRAAVDSRDLPLLSVSSELRYNRLLSSWVMYASHRQDRSYLPAQEDCPLCPSRPGHPTEIPEDSYQVVVFENRFPALVHSPAGAGASAGGGTTAGGGGGAVPGPGAGAGAQGLLEGRGSAGRCEVVCYTDDHSASFADLSPQRVDLVISALVDRTQDLLELPGVEQVYCFENRGREIGVTQPHPHGQIYAYPFVTPRTQKMLAAAEEYKRACGANLFDDQLGAEQEAGTRVIVATANWTAFVPHASRWPYEVHCYPNTRVPDLASLPGAARAELPDVLLDIFGRFARLFDTPAPYISGWHQAPRGRGSEEMALHLEMLTFRRANDKLKYLAGSESGMDAFANDILPEVAAERLRAVGTAGAPGP